MKKINLLISCCLVANSLCFAQDFPLYGNLSGKEIDLKECSFDKDANAVVLIHEAFSNYDDDHHLVTIHHVRIKILKEKGISSADISIPFYREDDFEKIDGVEGMTINIDNGNQVKTGLDRKSIFTRKLNERLGEVVFAFPAIRPGSVIDYKYRSTMKHYGGLEDWNFQEELPVLVSKYTLIILPNVEFAYRVSKANEMAVVIKKEPSDGSVYFEMQNIPGLGDEPYMDARRDYLQKVIFQLSGYNRGGYDKKSFMTSWDGVTRELLMAADFGGQLNKSIPGTGDFIKQVKTMALPEEKMKAVFNYVRSNINWNHLYSKYSTGGVKEAWQKTSGSSADINLALVNLLKEASLDAYPMLVSERFHGKVNTAYPFIDQFNSVFACVIINNKKYYLDATDKSALPQLTPLTILNTTAFIVNRKAGGLIDIINDTAQFKEDIFIQLELSENGTLSGDVSVKSSDYARIKKLEDYKEDKADFVNKYFTVNGTNLAGKELELINIENDSMPFEQRCKLSGQLNTAGDYTFLPLNFFTGFNNNPFVSDSRFSNINFGYKRSSYLYVAVQLPAGYLVDEIPKSITLTDPDRDIIFVRHIDYDKKDNSIVCMMKFDFKKSLYDAEMYPVIKQVYKNIFDYLKEPIVLKKK